ncbi:MAG: Asp-tRNA(Asn)/Glu-tRNA(Gln) amidotransferase subunit GatB [Spirochaetales bacterium]
MKYDIVIGLEVHSELKTNTKAFCSCKNEFGGMPNINCCPVCLGLPGALPVANKTAVEYTIRAGLAFNSIINNEAIFERKNYFYPDLSKAYQISQLEKPICVGGSVEVELEDGTTKHVSLNRIHMEEDAGKNMHDDFLGISMVDFNRCGVPLIEIVSEPEIYSSDEAVRYLDQIRQTLIYIGVTDGKMQEGSLRCDVNVSLKEHGCKVLGNRTEMKNLNSFKAVKRAIDYEVERQASLLGEGKTIDQETRRWDDNLGKSFSMRNKENSNDYRYFPDRDLLPINITEEYIAEIKKHLPELPISRKKRYIDKLGLPEYDAKVLTNKKAISDFFEECLTIFNEPKAVSNFIMSHVLRVLKEDLDTENINIKITAQNLCAIIKMAKNAEINSSGAKTLFEAVWETGKDANDLVESLGLKQVSDEGQIEKIVLEIIDANPQAVIDYKAGNTRAITFFMGQVMKMTKGKANPGIVNKLIEEQLNKI